MESIVAKGGGDYFAAPIPLTSTPAPLTPGVQVNIPYDVKVAREFDRISKELVNAQRFGDPTADAISRLRERIGPVPAFQRVSLSSEGQTLVKKSSAFGLSMAWTRSPDKSMASPASNPTSTKSNLGAEKFGGADRGKMKEIIAQLWFDEANLSDFIGMTRVDDDEEEVTLRRDNARRGRTAPSH